MPRKVFLSGLQRLNDDMVKMAVMTEISIDEAVRALENKDVVLANKVVSGDDHIDEMQRCIEYECMGILSHHNLEESEVRLIISILKMTTDIERIADHATDISEIVIDMDSYDYIWDISPLRRMCEFAKQMIKDSIRAYVDKDIMLAKAVCECDNEVDKLFYQVLDELRSLMRENPEYVDQSTQFMLISKYLERIADHSTNLAEWVIYIITGEFVIGM